jgi:hypothetical protein
LYSEHEKERINTKSRYIDGTKSNKPIHIILFFFLLVYKNQMKESNVDKKKRRASTKL